MSRQVPKRRKPRREDVIKKLRAKGKTKPGTHVPIMPHEILNAFRPAPGQIIVDCTLGYGGHAEKFLQHLKPDGKLIALDMDHRQLEKTKKRLTGKFDVEMSFHHANFASLPQILKLQNISSVDAVFADLGLSSMQIDDPLRGIHYKHKSPLDMRMNTTAENTAADLINSLPKEKIAAALKEYSDEPDSEKIAQLIVTERTKKPITQTNQLLRLVFQAKAITRKEWDAQRKKKFNTLHPAARTFQAFRILVNDEINSLKKLLDSAPSLIKTGGKIGFLAFHRGEDKPIKTAFKAGLDEGTYSYVTKKAIMPRINEIKKNPRCSSAKFRYAVKAE